jgi:alkaline phosphatase D
MSQLIVGHVTASTARIWTRGEKDSKEARLRYRRAGTTAWEAMPPRPLLAHRGFVEVFDLSALAQQTAYECQLSFKAGKAPQVTSGTFTTAPTGPAACSFLFGSCNWSRGGLIKIGNARKSWEGVKTLVEHLEPDFMLHCGDQVYADIISHPLPEFMHLRYYRSLYQDAWKVRATAEVLASLPHYMILDDHEIFDDFHNGKSLLGRPSDPVRDFAKVVYQEYQDSHNPQNYWPAYHYSFDWAAAKFFVVDSRSERHKGEHSTIVSPQQMARLKDWLRTHRDDVKFVATAVPFVGEARSGDDKWSGTAFRHQRDELIDFLAAERISKLVFLTGDMHCSYHATMTLSHTDGDLVIHELMSSPINQVGNGIHALRTSVVAKTAGDVDYSVNINEGEFYGAHSNVMRVEATAGGQVSWSVYRTKAAEAIPTAERSGVFQL